MVCYGTHLFVTFRGTGGASPPGHPPLASLDAMTDRYTLLLRPGPAAPRRGARPDTRASAPPGGGGAQAAPLRTARVTATGELGVSGYPRYAGEGVQADIDPRTRAVEAVTLDGAELPYGWTAQVADD